MPGCIIGPHQVSITIRSPLIRGLIEHSRTLRYKWSVGMSDWFINDEGKGFLISGDIRSSV